MSENRNEILELYKLHAELADRVSQRREGANRLFVSLLTGLMVFLAALLRLGTGDLGADTVMGFFGIAGAALSGAALSGAWYVVIRSYRRLTTCKFKVLHELEKKLPYPFFQREWDLLRKGRAFRRYWRLTVVETSLPIIFFLLFVGVLAFAIIR